MELTKKAKKKSNQRKQGGAGGAGASLGDASGLGSQSKITSAGTPGGERLGDKNNTPADLIRRELSSLTESANRNAISVRAASKAKANLLGSLASLSASGGSQGEARYSTDVASADKGRERARLSAEGALDREARGAISASTAAAQEQSRSDILSEGDKDRAAKAKEAASTAEYRSAQLANQASSAELAKERLALETTVSVQRQANVEAQAEVQAVNQRQDLKLRNRIASDNAIAAAGEARLNAAEIVDGQNRFKVTSALSLADSIGNSAGNTQAAADAVLGYSNNVDIQSAEGRQGQLVAYRELLKTAKGPNRAALLKRIADLSN